MIRLVLPLGHHEGIVTHEDFEKMTVDFTIDSTDDVIIPLVLKSLPSEDRLDRQLDLLIERAERIDKIRLKLWEAFQKQGETLVTIPAYKASLSELLAELGFEPEAWIAKASKRKGMVRRLLKRDDRIDGLRRDILRLAEDSRQAGGLMLMSEFLVRLDDLGWDASHEDIYGVLTNMSREGLIEGIDSLNGGARLVKFIPVELTDDPQKILGLATEKEGRLTIEAIVVELGWPEERVKIAMNLLVEKGVAKVQESYSTSTVFWFPGLRRKE
jgi:DNA-binding PadR family transcriptional regulator